MFKKGDKVILIKNHNMCAKVGATATVMEDYCPGNYLRVEWDVNDLIFSSSRDYVRQSDGGYSSSNFELFNQSPFDQSVRDYIMKELHDAP